MAEQFRIRPMEKGDCKEAARIRFEAEEWGILPAMGPEFFTELLKSTCESKWGLCIVSTDDSNKILGFVCATTDLNRYYLDIIMHKGVVLVALGFCRWLQKPKLFKKLLSYFCYPGKASHQHIKAEWLTLSVKREYRNKGIGKKLTMSLIQEYKKRGVRQFRSTVHSSNNVSCLMHDRFGFKHLGTFELYGELMNAYIYEIQ